MNDREKRLVAAVALVGVFWVGNKGLTKYRDAVERNAAAQLAAVDSLADAQFELALGQRARRALNEWRRESLPTNRDVARSLYQDWLRREALAAGLSLKSLVDNSTDRAAGSVTEVSFAATAQGTLEALTKFLYQFYSAPHLHRISASDLTTTDGGKQLSVTLNVDGLILPDASRSEQLADGDPRELKLPLDQLQADILNRNLFAAYQPNSTKTADAGGKGNDEEANGAKITGVTYGGGGWLAMVEKKDASTLIRFRAGDPFEIGRMKGRFVEIDIRRVIVETDQGRLQIRVGKTFGDAEPIDEEES